MHFHDRPYNATGLNQGWSYVGPDNKEPDLPDCEAEPDKCGNCTIWFSVSGSVAAKGAWSHQGPQANKQGSCVVFSDITGQANQAGAQSHVGPPSPGGTCKVYKAADTKTVPSKGAFSGGPPVMILQRTFVD